VLGLACALCAGLYLSLGKAMAQGRRLLRAVLIAAALVLVFHAVLQQPMVGVVSVLRMVAASLLSIALTLSTRSGELQDVLEWLLAPLQRFGARPDRFALQLGLMLRFIGHFFTVWTRLDEAYRLRTGKSGGLRLLAPLTIQMLQTARRVADTLDVRLGE
jgi:biotin transport system permease protein